MSTPIKSFNLSLTFVKTLFDVISTCSQSDCPRLQGAAIDVVEALYPSIQVSNVKHLLDEQQRSIAESKLLATIVNTNIADHQLTYSEPNMQDIKHNRSRLKHIECSSGLIDVEAIPLDSYHVGLFLGLCSDVLHGIDETTIYSMLERVCESLFTIAIVMQDEYTTQPFSLEQIATSFVSVNKSGDIRLNIQGAMKGLYDILKSTGTYDSETATPRCYYGDDILASLLETHCKGSYPSSVYVMGTVSNDQLPSLVGLSELKVNISSDIPAATERDFYIVAYAIYTLNERLSDPVQMKTASEVSQTSECEFRDMADKMRLFTKAYHRKLAQGLKGFRDFYNLDVYLRYSA